MADSFDFNTEPAPDETINMEHRSSDGDDSDERDELPFEEYAEEDDDDREDDASDDEEEMDYGEEHAMIDAAFGKTTNLLGGGCSYNHHDDDDDSDDAVENSGMGQLVDREAIEGSDEDEDDEDGDEDDEGWETTSSNYGGINAFDSENDDTDYDNGAYDSSDSWDDKVEGVDTEGIDRMDYFLSEEKAIVQARARSAKIRENLAKAPKKFPQFMQLPPELRMRIWETFCSELRRKNRVVQVMMQSDGRLTPAVTMDQQTEPTRRFMRICRETRAMGLRALPDTLHIGVSKHDKGEIRFNAETDVVHFLEEHPFGLMALDPKGGNAGGDDDALHTGRRRTKKKKGADEIPEPYTSVRNLAINDMERRLREPGAYQDDFHGHMVVEMIDEIDASHRRPSELRDAVYLKSLEYLFPNLENLYAVEHGAVRYLDRWTAKTRSYQRYHVRGYEVDDIELHREPVEYLYCWHEPVAPRRRRLEAADKEAADKKDAESAPTEEAAETAEDKLRQAELAKDQPEDFKEECVLNHFAKLRERGVRFSRMLFFDGEDGMSDYCALQTLCRPDGSWPKDADGNPRKDQQPSRDIDAPSDIEVFLEDDYDEDDSMIADEDEDEEDFGDEVEDMDGDGDEDDQDDEDDLLVVDDDEDDDEEEAAGPPPEAMFSSPEPEPEGETSSKAGRGKKRRVVDSDDEEDESGGGPGDANNANGEGSRSPAKRQRRTAIVSSDEEEEDTEATSSKKAGKSGKAAESEASSHTEPGDADGEDEWEDEKPEKPLTLMQMLMAGRKANPIEDEEEDDDESDEAGDYGHCEDDLEEEDDE